MTPGGLFEDTSRQLVIPLYQRPFSWERDKLLRLWNDILKQAAAARTKQQTRLFLGSVVLTGPEGPDWCRRSTVIDGQRRLTSLLVAMCALRDHLRHNALKGWDSMKTLGRSRPTGVRSRRKGRGDAGVGIPSAFWAAVMRRSLDEGGG